MKQRKCAECGKQFSVNPKNTRQKLCGQRCSETYGAKGAKLSATDRVISDAFRFTESPSEAVRMRCLRDLCKQEGIMADTLEDACSEYIRRECAKLKATKPEFNNGSRALWARAKPVTVTREPRRYSGAEPQATEA